MARTKNDKNNRQTRESWVLAALETLHKEGIEKVRVERLAKKLGVTKGSFYWHFKDRTDLLDSLLDYWSNELTQSVLDYAKTFYGDPRQRIYNTLDEVIGKERAAYDPAIRSWANHDSQAKRVVAQIDKIRMSFLQGLFVDAGFNEDDAEIRARLMYYYILGEHFVTLKEPMSIRMGKLRKKVDLLLQPVQIARKN